MASAAAASSLAAANSCTCGGSDACALAASREASDEGANESASADLLGGVFAASAAFAAELVGLDVVIAISNLHPIKL